VLAADHDPEKAGIRDSPPIRRHDMRAESAVQFDQTLCTHRV
jgi:hypothetical protein